MKTHCQLWFNSTTEPVISKVNIKESTTTPERQKKRCEENLKASKRTNVLITIVKQAVVQWRGKSVKLCLNKDEASIGAVNLCNWLTLESSR